MELLSPAGNPELALAAFDGGADAVYCGLGKFNARERAENFTADSLGRIIRFAHERGKKVYVTFNTLVFESELGEMFEYLCTLAGIKPDALIVQDPGVAATVRRYFPELTLHASTQMGIHNSAGLQCAANLGFKRVILERQITLEELEMMAADSPVELEVFLHGSLCCSLSGRCLLSADLCGASGNRGQCRQLCRKLYIPAGQKSGFYLSPADLAGTSVIGRLQKCGISSLKIEGRLRTPDYVWKTARAYRILLDSPGDKEAAAEAEKLLASAVGRNPGTAFWFRKTWPTLIDPAQSGVFGETAAKITRVMRRGILAKVATSLHLGDRLRAGSDGKSFSLTVMEKERGQKILKARTGDTVFIPGNFPVAPGCALLRIGENGFDFSRQAAALPEFQRRVDVRITAAADKFTGRINGVEGCWERAVKFAPAVKHPLDAAKIREVFASGAPAGFAAEHPEVEVYGNFFVPAAELKTLRREFWEFFAGKLTDSVRDDGIPEKMLRFAEARKLDTHPAHPADVVPENSFFIPPFVCETDLPRLRNSLRQAYRNGTRDATVSHWHGFALLKEFPEMKIHTAFPFPVVNSCAAELAAELGAVSAEYAPETPPETLAGLQKASPLPLHPVAGQYPLLVTRLPLIPGQWRDRDDHIFRVEKRDGMSYLFREK